MRSREINVTSLGVFTNSEADVANKPEHERRLKAWSHRLYNFVVAAYCLGDAKIDKKFWLMLGFGVMAQPLPWSSEIRKGQRVIGGARIASRRADSSAFPRFRALWVN